MKQAWENFNEYYNSREMRERMILMLLVFALIYGAFHYILFVPLEQKKAQATQRITAMGKEMTRLSAQEKMFAEAIASDPNANKKRELARLQVQIESLDKSINELSVGLIPAEKLPQALREVLNASTGLSLLGLESRSPTRLQLIEPPLVASEVPNEEGGSNKNKDELEKAKAALPKKKSPVQQKLQEHHVGVYKHTVVLALEGSYFNVITYLKSLENLPWKIYWHELDYSVTDYPKAEVLLEVYTLSTEEGFIGA